MERIIGNLDKAKLKLDEAFFYLDEIEELIQEDELDEAAGSKVSQATERLTGELSALSGKVAELQSILLALDEQQGARRLHAKSLVARRGRGPRSFAGAAMTSSLALTNIILQVVLIVVALAALSGWPEGALQPPLPGHARVGRRSRSSSSPLSWPLL